MRLPQTKDLIEVREDKGRAKVDITVARLLDVASAARYLALHPDTVRDLVQAAYSTQLHPKYESCKLF